MAKQALNLDALYKVLAAFKAETRLLLRSAPGNKIQAADRPTKPSEATAQLFDATLAELPRGGQPSSNQPNGQAL
jgi:hypothetical protein